MEEDLMKNCLSKIIVLMYHRIDETKTDPWGICVSPENFKEQIKFLKNNFNVISSAGLLEQIATDKIIDQSVCITFDDGYADNFLQAKPILEKYNCPATFFIATLFIDKHQSFWWDELEIIFLHTKKLPVFLFIEINGKTYEYFPGENILSEEDCLKHSAWKWYEEPPTQRCAVFFDLWEKLRVLFYEEIIIQMEIIRKWAHINYDFCTQRLPMNSQQLTDLSKNNLFSIGLHTHTHPNLYEKEKNFQTKEVLHCKKLLNDQFSINANMLAFPFGRYDETTMKVVEELKIDACFTTESVEVYLHSSIKKLGRFQVSDWDISTFKNQLNHWFNVYSDVNDFVK